MKKSMFLLILILFLSGNRQMLFAQTCGSRQLDPRVESFLKMIGYEDLTLELLRTMSIAQIKFAGPLPMPYPEEDVIRFRITADSIPD